MRGSVIPTRPGIRGTIIGTLIAHDRDFLDAVVTEIAATRVTERGETRADDRAIHDHP